MSAMYPEPDGLWTEGHSGTETSKSRARDDQATGRGKARQALLLAHLDHLGRWGATIGELRNEFPDLHHGQISSALSNLDRDGKVVMLAAERGKSHVYVLTTWRNDRDLAPRRRTSRDVSAGLREDNLRLNAEVLRLRDENSRLRTLLMAARTPL